MMPAAVVDAHVHFWDPAALPYPWLAPEAPPRPFGDHGPIKRRYGPQEYRADQGDVVVEACVHVQANCADPAGETAWLVGLAADTGLPTAHVAFVDLSAPNAADRVAAAATSPLVRGVRQLLSWHPDPLRRAAPSPGLMDDPAFDTGFRALARHGLSFDLGCLPGQLQRAAALADRHPGTVLVLNHLGWPVLDDPDGRGQWRRGLAAIARRPNVVLKVSGLWPVDRHWREEVLRPFVREAVGMFGFDRCLWGSNHPIERLMTSLPHQLAALAGILVDASPDDRDRLFRRTARRVYRLH